MRFLADMGVSPSTVRHLRELGHDAVHLVEQDLSRLSDAEIVLKARRESRVILTVDLDFAHLLVQGGQPRPSAIIFRTANKTPSAIDAALERCLAQFGTMLAQGAILSVSESAVRARRLPIRPPDEPAR
jgi:predicted nuclease of predicted toxin-antitoxin system